MEREKIVIRDSKRDPQVVVYSDHPYFEQIKNTMMPDEYREAVKKISNQPDSLWEEIINDYYEQIAHPYVCINGVENEDLVNPLFVPLVPSGTWIN